MANKKNKNKKYNENIAQAKAEKRMRHEYKKSADAAARQKDVENYYKLDTLICVLGLVADLILLLALYPEKPVWCDILLYIAIFLEVIIFSRNTSKTLKDKRELQIRNRMGWRYDDDKQRKQSILRYLIAAFCYRLAVPVLIIYAGWMGF